MTDEKTELTARTIRDFGDQWTRYTGNEGFYGDPAVLADAFGPLLSLDDLGGKSVAEIGSGTGRIVRMIASVGPKRIVALEPSDAYTVLVSNVADLPVPVECLRLRGDAMPAGLDLDYVVSIGVIHHIPDPAPVLKAAFDALRPGGRFLMWVYGREGNATSVRAIELARTITRHLPHRLLATLCHALNLGLDGYLVLLRAGLPLPFAHYGRNVIGKFSRSKRYLVIYDQLKPAYAKYYTGEEAVQVVTTAGFSSVISYHRHGYSWSVIGTKPATL